MRLGLTGRILAGGIVVAAFFLVQLVITLDAFRTIRHATREEERATASVLAASTVSKLVLDVQSGTRGYAITGQRRFLAPALSARAALPAASAALRRVAPGSFAAEVERSSRAYVRDWSLPLERLVAAAPARARARIATGAGRARVDRLERSIDGFVARQNAVVAQARQRVERAEDRGLRVGALGVAFRIAVFLAAIVYLLRAIVVPLRRIAAGTREVGRGELGAQVPERGAGEVGELARSFNEMSRSLVQTRSELGDRNTRIERGSSVLKAVLDSTVDGILLSDEEGNVRLANRPMVRLAGELGFGRDGPVVDRLLSAAGRVVEPERYRAAMERLRAGSTDETFDEFEDRETGRVFQGFTAPVLDDRGSTLGRIWTLREVTRQRELDRLKDDFVATVSHELRTPLTSMVGFLEMLRAGEAGALTDEQRRFLEIVHRSSERLQRLVGDLLFVSRLDANGLQLQLADVCLDDIARDAVDSHTALAHSRRLELVAGLEPLPPLRGDAERLAQLAANLVSNALKFTPDGGRVEVRTFVGGANAVLEVEDTGIGIPPAELQRVFERFFRSSAATEQAIPGTGLGLAISKAIVDAHDGTISVRSRPGGRTRFRVELPLVTAS